MRIPRTDLTCADPFYVCPICNEGYWGIGQLSYHVKLKHPRHYGKKVSN